MRGKSETDCRSGSFTGFVDRRRIENNTSLIPLISGIRRQSELIFYFWQLTVINCQLKHNRVLDRVAGIVSFALKVKFLYKSQSSLRGLCCLFMYRGILYYKGITFFCFWLHKNKTSQPNVRNSFC